MIISPPFLLPELPKDKDPTEAAMLASTTRLPGAGAHEGAYPVSHSLAWHNGVHLQAQDTGVETLSLRAIADGEIVFLNRPTPPTSDPQHSQNYNPFGSESVWTDNGCIILKHETETGADGNEPVSIVYYSVYMHAAWIKGGLEEGKKVYRKDELGKAGKVYGRDRQVHFEICCDASNLKKITGRDPIWQDPQEPPTKDGRTDSVFGSVYIYLPATTPVTKTLPADHLCSTNTNTLGTAQWIKIEYGDSGTTAGACTLTSYSTAGRLGTTRTDKDAEYNLYKEATDRHNSVVKAHPNAKSSPSGWYELLRFGRNLGRSATDKDLLPDNAAHWRKIKTIDGAEVWADLNTAGAYKFSDADFLLQFGWNFYDDDSNPTDQRCDSARLKALIRAEGDQPDPERNKDEKKLAGRLDEPDVMQALRRAVCLFPSEWDRNTISHRYDWLNEMEYGFKDHPEDWARFENHLKAITFGKLPQAYLEAQWHFHPTEFISLFRKCGWLSANELIQLFPKSAMRESKHRDKTTGNLISEWLSEPIIVSTNAVNRYQIELNKSARRYGIVTPRRMAAFYANAMQETMWFGKLHEGNDTERYAPWDGRGFLQLTWPDNYIKYWQFIGKAVPASLAQQLHQAAIQANSQRTNTPLADTAVLLPANMKTWRDSVARDESEAANSAGAYWVWSMAAQSADADAPNIYATKTVNGKSKVYYTNSSFGNVAGTVNLGRSTTAYHSVNGIVARFQAYTAAQMALFDTPSFPDAKGNLKDSPEDFISRRP